MSFSEALKAAQTNDAPFRAAGFEYDAARYGVPIARAQLLPVVGLSASESAVAGSRRFPNSQNQEVRIPLDYGAPQVSLNVRMPLFNFDAISGYRQAQAQSEVAEAVFRSQGLDLVDRLAAVYVQVLVAEETRRLTEAQVKAYALQAEQAARRLDRGEGTRVQVAQAQATVDVARTRLLEASDLVDLSRSRLERLTGVSQPKTRLLPAAHTPVALFPERLGDWIEMALRQNPSLQAQERSREVARQFTRRQTSGHLPKLDLVASVGRNENDASNAVGQVTTIRSVGVQLSVPLFSGGGVDASVKQATLRESQVAEEVRRERETIEVDIQRHYQAVVNGEKRVASYLKALESTALAVQGARRALETGLGTNSDLAEAQAVNFSAARDLAQARTETLLSRVRLMLRAGMPMQDVATEFDRFLTEATADATESTKP
jgi:TolC family type I secretion outer membrane protein